MTDRIDDIYLANRSDVNIMATPGWDAAKQAGLDPGVELLGGRPYYASIEDRHEPGILNKFGVRADGGEELLNSTEVDNADIIDPGFGVGMEPGETSENPSTDAPPAETGVFEPNPNPAFDNEGIYQNKYLTGVDDLDKRETMLAGRAGNENVGEDLASYLSPFPKALLRGGRDALNSNIDMIEDAINYFVENKVQLARLPEVKIEGDNAVLNIVSGVTQFLAPFGLLGKLGNTIKFIRTLKKSGALGSIPEAMLRGALVDFSSFDPKLGNLSKYIQTTSWANPINEYLTHDEKTENWLVGRLKNTVEGAVLGGLIEIFVRGGLATMKRMRRQKEELQGISDTRKGASETPADFKSSSDASGDINMVPKPGTLSRDQVPDAASQRIDSASSPSSVRQSFAKTPSTSRIENSSDKLSSSSDVAIKDIPKRLDGPYHTDGNLSRLIGKAEASKPDLEQHLSLLANDVKGAEFTEVRVKKLAEAQLKADYKGGAEFVGDLLGGRIVVDTEEALQNVLKMIHERFDVVELDDFVHHLNPDMVARRMGYRAAHFQISKGDFAAEIQVVPRPIFNFQEGPSGHILYKKWKNLTRGLKVREMLAKQWDFGKLREGYDTAYLKWRRDNDMEQVTLSGLTTATGAAGVALTLASPRVGARVAVRSGKTTAMRESTHFEDEKDGKQAAYGGGYP